MIETLESRELFSVSALPAVQETSLNFTKIEYNFSAQDRSLNFTNGALNFSYQTGGLEAAGQVSTSSFSWGATQLG